MAQNDIEIKISVEAQLTQLKAMEAQLDRQVVALRTLGGAGTDNLKKVEQNLGLVRNQLAAIAPIVDTLPVGWERAGAAAAKSTQAMAGGMGSVGRFAGQAGYQIQDFVVQVGAGQNALIAFAQQGSQLIGMLGPYGAMAGAALAIGAVAANFFLMSDGAKEAKEQTAGLVESLKEIYELQRQRTFDGLKDEAKITDIQSRIASLRQQETLSRLTTGVEDDPAAITAALTLQGKLRLERTKLEFDLADLRKKMAEDVSAKERAEAEKGYKAGLEQAKQAEAYQTRVDALIVRATENRRKNLNLDDQLQVAENELLALKRQMPAEDDKSAIAADKRLATAEKLIAKEGEVLALRRQVVTEVEKENAAAEKAAAVEAQRTLSLQLAASSAANRALDDNPLLFNATKEAARTTILQDQNRLIAERIQLLEQQQRISNDPTRAGQIDALRGQMGTNNAQIGTLTNKPSIGGGAMAGTVAYLNSIPSAAQRAQQAVMIVGQAMQQGIATSLRGLIDGTMQWGEALANIGNAIVNAILQSFVDMIAQWIVSHTIMAAIKKAFSAEDLGTTVATEGAKTAAVTTGEGARVAAVGVSTAASTGIVVAGAGAQTAATGPAAVFRSIMELGPIAGPLVFAAIIGGMLALVSSVSGHADGGLITGPGSGTSDSIVARLSNGEYVMPAAKTAQYRPMLDAMRDGSFGGLAGGGMVMASSSGGGGGSVVINQHFPTGVTRAEMAALIPEIERRTKAAIRDEQRRGKA